MLQQQAAVLQNELDERKRIEAELRRSQENLSDFYENATVGLHWFAADGTILRANKTELNMLGYAEDEYVGRKIFDFHAEPKRAHELLRRLVRKETVKNFSTQLRAKDGTVHHVLMDASALWDDGKLVHVRCFTWDVTDETTMQEELRRSEERFRKLAEAIPQLVWTATADGGNEYVNQKCLEYCGIPMEEGSLEHWSQALHPEDASKAFALWERSIRTGETFQCEYRLRRADGVYRWFLGRAVPERDSQGKTVRWVGTATDIEDHNNLVRELRQSKDELDVILHGVTDGITVLDPQGKFIYANQVGARLCGFDSVEEFLRATTQEIMDGFEIMDERGNPFPVQNLPGRLALSGVKNPPEVLLKFKSKKGGQTRWAIVNAAPVEDENGRVKFAISIFRDFTERKFVEDSLQLLARSSMVLASSLDYNVILQGIADLAVDSLADWCFITLREPECETPHLIARAHAEPSRLAWLKDEEIREPAAWNLSSRAENVLRTGHPELVSQIPVVRGDGGGSACWENLGAKSIICVPLQTRNQVFGAITLVSTDSGRLYTHQELQVAQDLANRTAVAVENSFLYKKAQEAVRARDEFLSIASHELKTPITSLKMQLQMTLRRFEPEAAGIPPEKLLRVFETSCRQVDRLTSLVEDMLDISRIQAGKLLLALETVDLTEIVREVTERFQEQFKSVGGEIHLHLDREAVGSWDRNRVEQILVNLLSNALKYAPGAPVEVSVRKQGGCAQLRIRDHGPGIPKEKQATIFERFERATSSHNINGLGLGLFIVKQIVEVHRGNISVESNVGEGTTFVVNLPFTEDAAVAKPGESKPLERMGTVAIG